MPVRLTRRGFIGGAAAQANATDFNDSSAYFMLASNRG